MSIPPLFTCWIQVLGIRRVNEVTKVSYLGKSTGKGALSLWLHHLKSISFSNYTSPYYTGPAVTYGAGVQAFEAFEAADEVGLQVVGGQCVTTGIAGGYTQGGGHSYDAPLSFFDSITNALG